jgi:RNA polymerase sigma-70 factor (ECF subfamily)
MADSLTVPDPDLPLVSRAQGGEYEAFEALVGCYECRIYTLARRIVGNALDAEEVVQETFLSLVEHLKDFEGQATFRTWLIRIATNHALKVLRRRRARLDTAVGGGDDDSDDLRPIPRPDYIAPWRLGPAEIAQSHESRQLLTEAIDSLDEKYRVVFVLRDVEGLSTDEAAQVLGISVSNAKVRLLRARLMLRERLTRVFGDSDFRVIGGHPND